MDNNRSEKPDEASQHKTGASGAHREESGKEPGSQGRSASDDLSEGLDLMLRAAKKAFGRVDASKLEQLRQRAKSSVDGWNRRPSGAEDRWSRDARRLEEIAEDAGRELLRVVERVTDRVENAVQGPKKGGNESTGPQGDSTSDSEQSPRDAEKPQDPSSSARERARVRIADDD